MTQTSTKLKLQRLSTFAPAFLFILAAAIRLLPGERIIDDAYITFRYARNIVEGLGFVYNPGQFVLGTTTPLYTLLMAGLAGLLHTSDYPALALGVNTLADGVACALLAPLGEALTGRRAVGLAAGFLYAIAPFSVTFAIGGMETSVIVLLLVATALLYLRGHDTWALTGALAILTRPDAVILILPLTLDWLAVWLLRQRQAMRQGGRFSLAAWVRPATYSAGLLVPWVLFASYYFGSPIPHSISAKTAAYHLAPGEGLIRLVQHYATPFFEQLTFSRAEMLLTTLVIYTALALTGGLAAVRSNRRTWPVVIYPYFYLAVFAAANPLIFRWYLTPPLPFYFLLILASVARIGDALAARLRRDWLSVWTLGLVSFAFAGLSARAWVLNPDHGPDRPAPDMAWFKLEELYTRIGREIAPTLKPGQVVAAGDIGAMGYFSRATILDTLGLISPESTRYYPLKPEQMVINYAISADLIADLQPDYVVFLEVYGRKTLLMDPRFKSSYRLRESIPTDIYGSKSMLVYERATP